MVHPWPRLRLAALLLVLLAMPVLAQVGQQPGGRSGPPSPQATGGVRPAPWNWWKPGSEFNEKLHLTKSQSDEIQRIFDAGWKTVQDKTEELNRQLEKLSKVNRPDETIDVISLQIDRVEASRSAANKERTLMLIKMRRVLNAEQAHRFEMLAEKWTKEQDQGQGRQDRGRSDPRSQPDARSGRPGF